MASNAGIVTGKQYIRFAETLEADTNEVFEFRPVFHSGAVAGTYTATVGTDAVGISFESVSPNDTIAIVSLKSKEISYNDESA